MVALMTVFFSYDPVAYVLEELGVGLPKVVYGSELPIIDIKDHLKINTPIMKNGVLEQMLYTSWPNQKEEEALKILLPTMKDGAIEEMKYTVWPNQPSEDALQIGLPSMRNGTEEHKTYTSHTVNPVMQLFINLPAMRDGILEEK